MISNDSPIECADAVHAVHVARFGPRAPNRIETCPAARLMIDAGMKNGEMRRGPPLIELEVLALDGAEPPDAGRDEDADVVGVLRRDLELSVADGELRRRDGELDEDVHLLDVFPVEVLQRVEPLDLTRNSRREVLRVEVRDGPDAVLAGTEGPPSSPRCRCRPRKASRRR